MSVRLGINGVRVGIISLGPNHKYTPRTHRVQNLVQRLQGLRAKTCQTSLMASASSVVEADFGESMLPLVTAQDIADGLDDDLQPSRSEAHLARLK